MKDDDIRTLLLFVLATVIGVLFIVGLIDGVGHAAKFLKSEWPTLSVGLLIFIIVLLGYLYAEHINESQKYLSKHIQKQLDKFETETLLLKKENSDLRCFITESTKRIDGHILLCKTTMDKVDKLLDQKGPLQPTVTTQREDFLLVDAISEFTGGEL